MFFFPREHLKSAREHSRKSAREHFALARELFEQKFARELFKQKFAREPKKVPVNVEKVPVNLKVPVNILKESAREPTKKYP